MATSSFERAYMSLPKISDKMAVACLFANLHTIMHNDLLSLIFVNDIKIIEDNMKYAYCSEIIVSFELLL